MVKRSIYVIILLFVSSPLFAKSQKEFLKEYNDSCFEAAQKKIALGKSREMCQCMTLNYKYLVPKRSELKMLIKMNKTNNSEGVPDPIVTMDTEVANQCYKDSNYLAEKAQRIKKEREEKKKGSKKPKSKKAAS